jgi:heterodisulfide reductase subunit A-like polyferredoxin
MLETDNMSVRFDQELCDLNPYCPAVRACPKGALFIDKKTFRPAFDAAECTGCGVCISSCPRGAVFQE